MIVGGVKILCNLPNISTTITTAAFYQSPVEIPTVDLRIFDLSFSHRSYSRPWKDWWIDL